MNDDQRSHLAEIQLNFIKEHSAKFEKGAIEHQSELHKDFTKEQLLDFALEEVIDLISYLYTLRSKL
jgi:hypothetical protein